MDSLPVEAKMSKSVFVERELALWALPSSYLHLMHLNLSLYFFVIFALEAIHGNIFHTFQCIPLIKHCHYEWVFSLPGLTGIPSFHLCPLVLFTLKLKRLPLSTLPILSHYLYIVIIAHLVCLFLPLLD